MSLKIYDKREKIRSKKAITIREALNIAYNVGATRCTAPILIKRATTESIMRLLGDPLATGDLEMRQREKQDELLKKVERLCEEAVELNIPDRVVEKVQERLGIFIDDTDTE